MGNKVSLEENLIDLKIVSKQMVRSSKKCEQKEKAAVGKLKKVGHDSRTPPLAYCDQGSLSTVFGCFSPLFARRFNKEMWRELEFTVRTQFAKRTKLSIICVCPADWMPVVVGLNPPCV